MVVGSGDGGIRYSRHRLRRPGFISALVLVLLMPSLGVVGGGGNYMYGKICRIMYEVAFARSNRSNHNKPLATTASVVNAGDSGTSS